MKCAEVRLRIRPVRSLHRDLRWSRHPLVHYAGTSRCGHGNHHLEGIGSAEKLHPLQKAFIEEQAAQCGFCLNGVIMTTKALLDKNPKAGKAEIEQALSGVLCRCFTHVRMMAAIEKAQREIAG